MWIPRLGPATLVSSALFFPVHRDIDHVLLSEERIRHAIDDVGARVTAAFTGRPFTVVSVLKGSCIFVADLVRAIPAQLELAFVSASSYGDGTESGQLEMSFFPSDGEIEGRHLLLVDDILDTGRTLSALSAELQRRGAASVSTCVFLDKPARRRVTFESDFRCFEIEDVFVVGYGLDFAGHYRNLPFVGSLKAEVVAAAQQRSSEA